MDESIDETLDSAESRWLLIIPTYLFTSLEWSEVVIYHHSIYHHFFLLFQFKYSSNCKIQSHAFHKSLQDVQHQFNQVDLIQDDAFELHAVDQGEVLSACQFTLLFF